MTVQPPNLIWWLFALSTKKSTHKVLKKTGMGAFDALSVKKALQVRNFHAGDYLLSSAFFVCSPPCQQKGEVQAKYNRCRSPPVFHFSDYQDKPSTGKWRTDNEVS